MTEIQKLIKSKGGCPAFARWAGESVRNVQAWKSGERAPNNGDCARIIRLAKNEISLELIQKTVKAGGSIKYECGKFVLYRKKKDGDIVASGTIAGGFIAR